MAQRRAVIIISIEGIDQDVARYLANRAPTHFYKWGTVKELKQMYMSPGDDLKATLEKILHSL